MDVPFIPFLSLSGVELLWLPDPVLLVLWHQIDYPFVIVNGPCQLPEVEGILAEGAGEG